MGDSYGGIFPLPGSQVTVVQNLGGKKKLETQTEGKTETEEARNTRKEIMLNELHKHIQFTNAVLGRDRLGNKITNDRLFYLIKKILGKTEIPPKREYQTIIEQLWVLLIDERNQCPKKAGEPYIRQTILNLIGYFVEKGIIGGQPREIARCIWDDTDTNMAKNVSRGIESNVFPAGLADMLDFYIEKLENGEY